jgi:hypothetical protein
LRVRAVAGEDDGVVARVDEHADLAGGVAGSGHECDVAGLRQAHTLREGPERLRLKLDRGGPEPGRPMLVRDVAVQTAEKPRRELENLVVREVMQAAA